MLIKDDKYGILDERGQNSFPYFALELTAEEAELVKGKIAGIYEIDGKQLFDLKPSSGKKVLFVIFV